jgi:hypothetical protein
VHLAPAEGAWSRVPGGFHKILSVFFFIGVVSGGHRIKACMPGSNTLTTRRPGDGFSRETRWTNCPAPLRPEPNGPRSGPGPAIAGQRYPPPSKENAGLDLATTILEIKPPTHLAPGGQDLRPIGDGRFPRRPQPSSAANSPTCSICRPTRSPRRRWSCRTPHLA